MLVPGEGQLPSASLFLHLCFKLQQHVSSLALGRCQGVTELTSLREEGGREGGEEGKEAGR